MNNYYFEKTTNYKKQVLNNEAFTEYYHPIIRFDIEQFPPVYQYLPVSFNAKFIFCEEEKYKIHSLIHDAYTRNSTFKTMVDTMNWNTDKIGVIKGFHESEVGGKPTVHFNVQLFKGDKSQTYHFIVDRFTPKIYKITFTGELEF